MATTRSKTLVLLMVLLVPLAAVGGVGAAGTITEDTETTETSHQSELQNSTTVNNITGNASETVTVELESDSNKTKVTLNRSGTGMPTAAVNASGVVVKHNASGAENSYLNHSFTHAQLLDVEHAAGENVTMRAWMFNNTSHSAPATANLTWFADFGTETATEVISDSDVSAEDVVTVTNESGGWFSRDTDKTRLEAEDVTVPNDTYYIAAANESAADDLTRALDEFSSSEKISTVGFGAVGPNAFVKVSSDDQTKWVPVYGQDIPDSVDTDQDLYAVASNSEVGGTAGVAVHNIDETFDASTVDVTMAAGTGTSGWFWGYTLGFNPLSMSIGGGGDLVASGGAAFLIAGTRRQIGA